MTRSSLDCVYAKAPIVCAPTDDTAMNKMSRPRASRRRTRRAGMPLPACQCSAGLGRKLLEPGPRHVRATGEPDLLLGLRVGDEAVQAVGPARLPHDPAVQPDVHQLRGLGALFVERVERLLQ